MILAIETSAEPASIAFFKDGEIVQREFPNKNQVNVPLADELALLLEGVEQVSEILVGAGPGSYSGARVGLATAEAIALVHSARVVTLPSLCGVAGERTLLGDARRGAYFVGQMPSPEMKRVTETVAVYEAEEFAGAVADLAQKDFVSFEPVEKLPLPEEVKNGVSQVYATAEGLIQYWNALGEEGREAQVPSEVLYVRPPNITKAKNPFA